MNRVTVIPVRYASSRFPGKALVKLRGRPVLGHVIDRCREAFPGRRLFVSTDDQRIFDFAALEAGVTPVMEDVPCVNGTHRVFETLQQWPQRVDSVLHVQGDEPLVSADMLRSLDQLIEQADVELATLAAPWDIETPIEDPHTVKVQLSTKGLALDFSRKAFPGTVAYGHLGVYAWKRDALEKYVGLEPSPREKAESLEQLRWIEAGLAVHAAVVSSMPLGVNTPADVAAVELALGQQNR